MAKKGGKQKAKSGGGSSGGKKRPSGIEKYGKDEVDEFMNLDEEDEVDQSESDVCEEEDVMGLDEGVDDFEAEEDYSRPKKKKGDDMDSEDEKEKYAAATQGWRRNEFYGGEDDGDDSDEHSDEDIIIKEAKRLEDLRAQQLAGGDDVLASLLGAPDEVTETASSGTAAAPGPASASTNASFDAIFAGTAEKISVAKEIAELPVEKRKSLLKKEAPEMMPLLNDFKTKLSSLQEILPLLRKSVVSTMPATGAAYLEAKASLLLNTLANLSFYLLLRAEGGAVRAHPVVPQLVWLRELHEQLEPLDEKIGPKMQRAVVRAKKALKASAAAALSSHHASEPSTGSSKRPEETPKITKKKTLRERIERMQLEQPAVPPTSNGKQNGKKDSRDPVAPRSSLLMKDLLRLPKAKSKQGAAFGPEDLDDIDPVLGMRAPTVPLGDQISSVQQQLKERAARDKAATASADQNTEPRQRKARERGMSLPTMPDADDDEPPMDFGGEDLGGDKDDPDIVKSARLIGRLKKEKKAQEKAQRADDEENARRLKAFKPEALVDDEWGRRKTSKKILDNRGLSRVRKKKAGNARVANKEKYQKTLKRRKGAVQEMRYGAEDGATYEGEATGVRTHVRKSLKIG